MTGNWRMAYQRWRDFPSLDPDLLQQLEAIQDDEQLLEDHFFKLIEFGTGGIRGEVGPGINRMNRYTVRKASEGLARYVNEQGESAKQAGVAIAYDSRHKSAEFALEAAKVLGKHGIRIYLFDRPFPTPLLSFAVRHVGAVAGIVITASHNPPEYNGFKVYDANGGQITAETAARLMKIMEAVGDELAIEVADEQELQASGYMQFIGDDLLQAYLEQVNAIRLHHLPKAVRKELRIVFTPLHGTTRDSIVKGLQLFGYRHVTIVEEQAEPDPDFSTVASPNPEDPQAFALAIRYAKETDADVVIGTDPDGDRLGVVTKNASGEYVVLSGNQVGALLLYDVLSQKQAKGLLPANGLVLKTIVTSELGRAIAADFGLKTEDTLTGFKYIGEKIGMYENSGEFVFQFGYEESCGYLVGDFVRDKDAVQSALLLADLCAYLKSRQKSLYGALTDLYCRYGYYGEELIALTCKGKGGLEKMAAILSSLRSQPVLTFAANRVTAVEDYLSQTRRDVKSGTAFPLTLPKSDTIKYFLADGSWFCIRPSGTEPKIKLYFGVKGTSPQDVTKKLSLLKDSVVKHIGLSFP